MPRPIKNNCDYFPHDAGMRNHKKVRAIRSNFGINGYAIWSMLLEHLTASDGNVFAYSDLEFELLSGDFLVSATEIRSVVDYCIRLELFVNESGFIRYESLDERLAPVYEKRNKAKGLSEKQLRTNGKYVTETPQQPVVSVTVSPQKKRKEIKGNKIKEKESNTTAIAEVTVWPTFEDFWKLYDKKIDRPKAEAKFKKISQREREKIMIHVYAYVKSTPDVKFRKNPVTYLNNESWNNEIIQNGNIGNKTAERHGSTFNRIRELEREFGVGEP